MSEQPLYSVPGTLSEEYAQGSVVALQRNLAHKKHPPTRTTIRVSVFGFRVSGFGFRVSDFGFRTSGFGFRISGFGLRASGFGFRVSGFGFRLSGFGFRVLGFGFQLTGARMTVVEPLGAARTPSLSVPWNIWYPPASERKSEIKICKLSQPFEICNTMKVKYATS